MANLLYRSSSTPTTPTGTSVKNAPMTNLEIDGNFKSIDNDLASKPSLTGVGASGTWNISVSGSAATLTTARTIGGVPFDGSADISLPGVNAVGNQNTTGSAATLTTARTIGGVPFNGSANINLPGVNITGNQNTSGNAATATVATVTTNLASGSVGTIPYQTAANTTAMLAAGTSGELLLSGGDAAPAWSTGLTYDTNTSTLSTTNFNSLSDINYKKSVSNIKGAINTVNKLNGVEFEWKDSNKKSSGVIAQELERILPFLVDTNKEGFKTVNYSGLIAYLIESVKELSDRLEKLEST